MNPFDLSDLHLNLDGLGWVVTIMAALAISAAALIVSVLA